MLPLAVSLLFGLTSVPESSNDVHVGDGPVIERGDRYTVTYQVGILGGKEIANSDLRGLPFSKELGDGHDGYFDRWVTGMSLGGKRKIVFGADQVPAMLRFALAAKTEVTVTLRLVGLKKKRPS